MCRNAIAVSAALLAGAVLQAGPSQAEDRATWFKNLKQPGTGISCCDISDCRRTEADWRDGQWWAVVDGEWMPIPARKLVRQISIDGDAYVCSGASRVIYCFVPPTMAM